MYSIYTKIYGAPLKETVDMEDLDICFELFEDPKQDCFEELYNGTGETSAYVGVVLNGSFDEASGHIRVDNSDFCTPPTIEQKTEFEHAWDLVPEKEKNAFLEPGIWFVYSTS